MNSIKKVSIVDSIVNEMLNRIRSGEFTPGERIPSEKVLAQEFGVSRTSLREAFKRLEQLGTISIHQGDGTYLNKNSQDELIMNEIRLLFSFDNTNISEYLESRKMLEVKAAGLAAQRASLDDITKLHKLVTDFENNIGNPADYKEIDFEFHQAIISSAKNNFIGEFWSLLIPLIKEQQNRSDYISGVINNSIISHHAIYEAIANRKVKVAEKCMDEHLSIIPGRLISEISRRVTKSEK